jgi:hypothetical protein
MAMSSGMPGANGPAGPNYDDKPAIRNTLRTRDDDTEFTEVTLARSNRLPEVAPKNTPSEIVDRLNKEINAVFADPTAFSTESESRGIGGFPKPLR